MKLIQRSTPDTSSEKMSRDAKENPSTSQRSREKLPRHPKDNSAKYYTKEEIEDSPSRRDGIDAKKELLSRRICANLIQEAGIRLRIPQWAIAAAIVFCHRFFAVKSLRRNDKYCIATACLFLAAKAEESPKPIRDVILHCEVLRLPAQQQKDAQVMKKVKDQAYGDEAKESIFLAERAVLYTLGFNFNLDHPYKYLLRQFAEMKLTKNPPYPPYNRIMQTAWNFVNDSLRTTLCLQYPPQEIATAAFYFAKEALGIALPLPAGKNFWQYFNVDVGHVRDIVNQMLDLWESLHQGTGEAINPVAFAHNIANSLNQAITANGGASPSEFANGHLASMAAHIDVKTESNSEAKLEPKEEDVKPDVLDSSFAYPDVGQKRRSPSVGCDSSVKSPRLS